MLNCFLVLLFPFSIDLYLIISKLRQTYTIPIPNKMDGECVQRRGDERGRWWLFQLFPPEDVMLLLKGSAQDVE